MKSIRLRAHYEHPISRWCIAAEIDDPWHDGGFFLYRLPETLTFADKPYITQPKGDRCWSGVQPEAAPEWSIDPNEKKTSYHIRFYDGLEFRAEAKAANKSVDFKYSIINKSKNAGVPSTSSCFMVWTSPYFIDRRHNKTFVWIGGKAVPIRKLSPTPESLERWSWIRVGVKRQASEQFLWGWASKEAADHGLIALKSSLDGFWIGLAWANAGLLMARSTIPCLHSEPSYPEIPCGSMVEVTGRLYFHEGSLQELKQRYLHDREEYFALKLYEAHL